MSIVSSVVPRCTLGAPRSSGARLVVAKRHGASRVLYTVLPKDVHERPRFAPWLGDIEDQLADNAVSEVDVFTYYDDEQPDDGARNVLAAVNTVLPVAGDDSPEDTWGEHVLVDAEREIWEEQEAQEDHNAAETAESDAAARSFA